MFPQTSPTPRSWKTFVTCGCIRHVSHAVFFPFVAKTETVASSVLIHMKHGGTLSVNVCSGNVSQSRMQSTMHLILSCGTAATTRATPSMSTVRITTFSCPLQTSSLISGSQFYLFVVTRTEQCVVNWYVAKYLTSTSCNHTLSRFKEGTVSANNPKSSVFGIQCRSCCSLLPCSVFNFPSDYLVFALRL